MLVARDPGLARGRRRGCADCASRCASGRGRGIPPVSTSARSCGSLMPARPACSPSSTAWVSSMRTVRGVGRGAACRRAPPEARVPGLSRLVGRHVLTRRWRSRPRCTGRKIAAAPSTHVYQPYGVMTTMRMKHTMRMPIVIRYRRRTRADVVARCTRQRRGRCGPIRTLHGDSRVRRAAVAVAGSAVRSVASSAGTCARSIDEEAGSAPAAGSMSR